MGNIKHNDELLRVHDDGFDVVFNCDNKHQNGVSYHAEKNGKKTKIDPEYAMAALVKKVSGAGWPADLPAPSAGGYGYTEPEKNVKKFEYIFTNVEANRGYLPPSANAFLLEEDQLYNITINGVTYERCPVHTGQIAVGLYCGDLSEGMPFEIMTGVDPALGVMTIVKFTTAGDKNVKVEKILGQEIHKINEEYLPEPEECRWPADMPLPAPDGFGYRQYLTKNSQVAETSGITAQNTMYLVQDLSEETMTTIRAGLKQDNVGPWNFYEIQCEYYSGNMQAWLPVEVSKYTTTKYEDSGENYYAEDGYQRFHMVFDRTKLSDEDAALFPKNGIYFEYHRNKAPTSISKARSAIYLKSGDPCKYSTIGDALYVKSSDGTKVMKITVASDGTITATEA